MEPLSITAACVGILGTIGPLVLKIRTFAVGVREARGKMGSLDQELSSPSMLIEILNDESNDPTFDYPLALRQSFVEVLGHSEAHCPFDGSSDKGGTGVLEKRSLSNICSSDRHPGLTSDISRKSDFSGNRGDLGGKGFGRKPIELYHRA